MDYLIQNCSLRIGKQYGWYANYINKKNRAFSSTEHCFSLITRSKKGSKSNVPPFSFPVQYHRLLNPKEYCLTAESTIIGKNTGANWLSRKLSTLSNFYCQLQFIFSLGRCFAAEFYREQFGIDQFRKQMIPFSHSVTLLPFLTSLNSKVKYSGVVQCKSHYFIIIMLS